MRGTGEEEKRNWLHMSKQLGREEGRGERMRMPTSVLKRVNKPGINSCVCRRCQCQR